MNILNKLTIKHLMMNKKRTITTIIGIILSTALMVGIGTFASSFREFLINQEIENDGSYHALITGVANKDYKYIENNANVNKKKLIWTRELGYAKINSKNTYKPYIYLINVNKEYLKKQNLLEGRLPANNHEILISRHTNTNGEANIKIGDTLNLDLSNRIIGNGEVLNQFNPYKEEETLKFIANRKYEVVGIMDRSKDEDYSAPGYTAITINEEELNSNLMNIFIEYKQIKNITDKTDKIVSNIDNKLVSVNYNEGLLSFYGESSYGNINDFLTNVILIVLALLVIACATVIYNSFAISVMERKKQFGLFSSIGATSKQLRKTVFFEAFIVAMIGIPIGIICGVGGISITILIINSLISEMIGASFTITLYPMFIILPILYMIITIIVSAYLPAKRAAKISPVEAIRLNDDIKINKNFVKTNNIIKKLFGIEGDIAYKNIKRNKKKYRITIISIFISVVLFISFSTFLTIGNRATNDLLGTANYDIDVLFREVTDKKELRSYVDAIKKIKGIDNLIEINNTYVSTKIQISNLTKDGIDMFKYFNTYEQIGDKNAQESLTLYGIDDKEYNEYLKKLNIKEDKIIIINNNKYKDEQQKTYNIAPFDNVDGMEAFKPVYKENREFSMNTLSYKLALSKRIPDSLKDVNLNYNFISAIVSNSMLNEIADTNPTTLITTTLNIRAREHEKVEKDIKKIVGYKETVDNDAIIEKDIIVDNITKNLKDQNNFVLVISILLYGFIILVSSIGITSVFNTINTSMALRRKEFAVLRSIGLSPKQFNKMIIFESIFYGIKSLFYALPVSFGFVVLFNRIFSDINYSSLIIPYKAIIISIVAVFVLTIFTMMYAVKKQKRENILDVIREENI